MAQVQSTKAVVAQPERSSPPKIGRTTWGSIVGSSNKGTPPAAPDLNGHSNHSTSASGRPPLPTRRPRPAVDAAAGAANHELRSSNTMPDRHEEEDDDALSVVRRTRSDDRMPRKLDKYGFIMNMDSQGNVFEDPDSDERIPTFAEAKQTERRERKWNIMLQAGEITNRRRRRKVLRRLRKGVPDNLRGRVWPVLGNVPVKRREKPHFYSELVRKTTEDVIQTAVNDTPQELPLTAEELTKHSRSFLAIHDTIERDIHRTYPRHNLFYDDSNHDGSSTAGSEDDQVLGLLCDDQVSSLMQEFEKSDRRKSEPTPPQSSTTMAHPSRHNELMDAQGGQAALRRVLRAYSLYDREVGYCQGMNFIAGMFLTFLSEEEAFWLLVVVMKEPPCRMRGLFGEGMSETHEVLFIAEKLMYQFLPRLTKHMEKENVHITMYATQWLLTLYTSSFPFDLVTRVWDCFLVEGWKVVYRVMLALLTLWQPTMLKMSFEEILAFFRDFSCRVDGHTVMEAALKIPLKTKHIVKLQKEWRSRQDHQQY